MQKGLLAVTIFFSTLLNAHCQMPCGIYHDDMVYDQVDQAVETLYKGVAVLNQTKFTNVHDMNEAVRWICEKDKICDDTAVLITEYFLQQKIKPDDPDTPKRLTAAHKLLFYLVAIKQNTDLDYVKQFNEEWEKFKLMFHREGYECEMEKKNLKALEDLRKAQDEKKASQKSSTSTK